MIKSTKIGLLLIISIFSFFSCDKNDYNNKIVEIVNTPVEKNNIVSEPKTIQSQTPINIIPKATISPKKEILVPEPKIIEPKKEIVNPINEVVNNANLPVSSNDVSTVQTTPEIIKNKHNLPVPKHIVIVVLENHAFEQIIDDSAAPYINQIVKDSALFTESYGLTHPSQPNYLMLFSGATQGIKDDKFPQNIPFSTPNLAASLLEANHTFVGYSEDLPSIGFKGEKSGEYASKHSPWVYWQGVGKNRLPDNISKPFTDFPKDFNNLPDVSFVIPNMDNDMHNGIFNGIIKDGDKWLKNNLDSYVQWVKNNDSLLIITFDEDNYFHRNNIATLFIGNMVKNGKYSDKITHYNILRTIEDMFELPYAGESVNAQNIASCWK
ncbi:MAG: alkaline phosphatase family protein [Cyanobacteriota bacterium]